jgi:hypothetical protein
MNCREVPLDEYLDGELDASARLEVEAHLASCEVCGKELGRSRRLENLLRRVPGGEAPDLDRYWAALRRQARHPRGGRWGAGAAAALLLGGILYALLPDSRPVDVGAELKAYAETQSREAEDRLRRAGPQAWGALERALGESDVRLQFAAATLLFKLGDEATRKRVLAGFESRRESGSGWTLFDPGTEKEDIEMVPVAVSALEAEGQERWALDVLRRLNRLDRAAHRKIVESVVTLLRSQNVRIQGLALDIVRELEIEFPLSSIVDLLDSPELGGQALRTLREATGQDFGRDKDAWRKAIQKKEGA